MNHNRFGKKPEDLMLSASGWDILVVIFHCYMVAASSSFWEEALKLNVELLLALTYLVCFSLPYRYRIILNRGKKLEI